VRELIEQFHVILRQIESNTEDKIMPQENSTLTIKYLRRDQISDELDQQIDALDHLAFCGPEDPEVASIEWASSDWMALGFMEDILVTQLCMLKREILVGGEPVWVGGVGGVATHPGWQRRGMASQLLHASETFMCDQLQVPFGLLVCDQTVESVYARCGWQTVAQSLYFVQDGKTRLLKTLVMVLPLAEQAWRTGEINLCGAPW
jgi:predicted acetyltransferase